jgi:hypothetical protein
VPTQHDLFEGGKPPGLTEGLAWFAGTQAADNSLDPAPPFPFLCAVSGDVAGRGRWAARTGIVKSAGREIVCQYYADPETRLVYAQPHPSDAAFGHARWGIPSAVPPRSFEDARELARWLFRRLGGSTKEHEAWWRAYLKTEKAGLPRALELPSDPQLVYRGAGWVDFKDWLVKPAAKAAAEGVFKS